MNFTPDQTIAEVLKSNPNTAEVFMRHGMHCLGCRIAIGESVAQAALAHGIDINELMEDLNKASETSGNG